MVPIPRTPRRRGPRDRPARPSRGGTRALGTNWCRPASPADRQPACRQGAIAQVMLDHGVAEQPGLGWAAAARGWCRPGRRRVSCQRPSWWQTGQVRRLARRSQRAWVRALVSASRRLGSWRSRCPPSRPVTCGVGWGWQPRTCDRAIMSRFPTVHDVVRSIVLAAQVSGAVHLVASRLAGSAWWNDRENDRDRSRSTRSVAWCSASIWSAPDGSGLLRSDASSIWSDPDRSRRIVWMINGMIKCALDDRRLLELPCPRRSAMVAARLASSIRARKGARHGGRPGRARSPAA
jgi:hypothetical protein